MPVYQGGCQHSQAARGLMFAIPANAVPSAAGRATHGRRPGQFTRDRSVAVCEVDTLAACAEAPAL
jgi:hypothetical protein